jgi:SfnB family sulfur acquisition oxidoreductase
MSIKLTGVPIAPLKVPDALGLAFQLGELTVDFRRRGVLIKQYAEWNQTVLEADVPYTLQFENPAAALVSLSQGEELKIIGLSLQHRREFILTRGDSQRRAVNDLKGAKLGIFSSRDSVTDIGRVEAVRGVETALELVGLSNSDIIWTELDEGIDRKFNPQATQRELQALLSGEVDAIYASGASGLEAQRLIGVRAIEGYTSYVPVLFVLTAPNGLIESHPEWVDRTIGHATLAARWAYNNRGEANRLAARQLGLPENAVESAFSEQLHQQFDLDITDEKWAQLARLKQDLLARGLLYKDFRLDNAVDWAKIDEAKSLIGKGEIEAPLTEGIAAYSAHDLPLSFFKDRNPAGILTSDEEALQAAKAFAEEIKMGSSDRDRYRKLPLEEMKRFAEYGLLGLVVPKAFGGADVNTRTLVEVFKIISKADGALGQIPQNHHFFVKTIELVGSDQQKQYFFSEILRGAQFGNALAERGIKGVKNMSTRLTRINEAHYELSGSKYYSTGALYSHWIPVTALDEEEKRVTVLVPRHEQGVTVVDDWTGIGQRTTASGSVILRKVSVQESNIIPHWKIFEGPQYFSAFGQIMHAAIDLGIAQAALEDAAYFVREYTRPSYNSGFAKASDEPDLIRRFGELGIRLQSAEALLDKAADAIDKARERLDEETAGRASLTVDSAKWLAAETVIEITNALFEVAGTSSMDRKHNFDRHWRNARIHTLHDPARLKLHNVGKWFLNGIYHEYKI